MSTANAGPNLIPGTADPGITAPSRPAGRTLDASVAGVLVTSPRAVAGPVPVTFGIPFAKGTLTDPTDLSLQAPDGASAAIQTSILARWSDGSVKWLLLDALLGSVAEGQGTWSLVAGSPPAAPRLRARELEDRIEIDAGPLRLALGRSGRLALRPVEVAGQPAFAAEMVLTDTKGRRGYAHVERAELEARGPVRGTVRLEGRFEGRVPCRFVARLSAFAETGLIRVDWAIHNPNRARHPGGKWDLGDRGSYFFRDLSCELTLAGAGTARIGWEAEPGLAWQTAAGEALAIEQLSSGGAQWRSRNHVNRRGVVPHTLRGFRVRCDGREERGLRASPLVAIAGPAAALSAALPEFWQQFPKAIEVNGRALYLRLFPAQYGDPFELQGGEQKTHTFWLHYGPPGEPTADALDWVYRPVRVGPTPDWVARSGAIPHLLPAAAEREGHLAAVRAAALDVRTGLAARRELIDEYGWRHYGDVFADHEQEHYVGPLPVISHYNNQYDLILGLLIQYLQTGDPRWWDLFEPLTRHVCNIDIYHTRRDRAAYNGGLFWFTDHYRDAKTSTHRTYSRGNCRRRDRSYGGGPSSNHLFTTGLLHAYYLGGDPAARDAVLELADWVREMDDGRRTILGLIDAGPTGRASVTATDDYHGPGRGSGNSVTALLDAWLLTSRREYLDAAEVLIRRTINPADDIAARGLLDAEKKWSYTVFLVALARYLEIKAEAGELDTMYTYARASLVAYARWMLEHERPYFDRRDELEYPTEAWPGQELRKANVFRRAASHVTGPLREAFLARATVLADRAWSDLMQFATWDTARGLALCLAEAPYDSWFRTCPPAPLPEARGPQVFGPPIPFVPQKARVRARLRTASGLLYALGRLADVRAWFQLASQGRL